MEHEPELDLVPIDRHREQWTRKSARFPRGYWKRIFAGIPPGQGARFKYDEVFVLKARTAVGNARRRGEQTDLFTFTKRGPRHRWFYIAREAEQEVKE